MTRRPTTRTKLHTRARPRIWAYGAVTVLVIAVFAALSVRPLQSGRSEQVQVHADDLALRQVLDYRATLADWQVFVEPYFAKLSTTVTVLDPVEVAKGAQYAQSIVDHAPVVARTLRELNYTTTASKVSSTSAAFTATFSILGSLAAGKPAAVTSSVIAAERTTYLQVRTATATAALQLRDASDLDSAQAIGHFDNGRGTILLVDALAAAVVILGAIVLGQRARRREVATGVGTRRHEFEATLQEALEMSKTETDVYGVMTEALHESVPNLQVEMLVADSSRAHFHQTLHTDVAIESEIRSGCGVASPLDCPAARRGRTLLFPTSQALNACPHLKNRESGDLSAVCIAISITGQTSGVVHATGPDHAPPSDADVRYLETTSRRVSERIAMLRAFAKSEAQARTDPLTGLWNRRSLENRVNDMQREDIPYALAYGDLDHFKILNDTHGHEAGDQALRLFSRVLQDSIRPNDLTARYGGEEFVVVLPECDTKTAAKVLERLRERLVLTLTNGRVPPFTVSFGISSSHDADTFDEVVALADQALLAAKTSGRNRTVLASDPIAQWQPIAQP